MTDEPEAEGETSAEAASTEESAPGAAHVEPAAAEVASAAAEVEPGAAPAAGESPEGGPPGASPPSESPAEAVPETTEAEILAAAEAAARELTGPELRAIVEALVFAAPQPLTLREMARVVAAAGKDDLRQALEELKLEHAREGRGLQVVEVAGGYQITTRPEYNDWVRELLDPKAPTRLSIQALETLAVIAYKQPVTLPEIIELRGVRSGGVVKTLLEKRLIRITGRKEVVGRPMLYGTTKDFLLHFGMKDLTELPKIEEFAEVLGEEVDVVGLKRAIEAPSRIEEAPLGEEEAVPEASTEASEGDVTQDGSGDTTEQLK